MRGEREAGSRWSEINFQKKKVRHEKRSMIQHGRDQRMQSLNKDIYREQSNKGHSKAVWAGHQKQLGEKKGQKTHRAISAESDGYNSDSWKAKREARE